MRALSRILPAALASAVLLAPIAARAQVSAAQRPIRATDLYRLRNVGDPQLSPDGAWVAYTVASVDSAKDKTDADIWMATWDGTQNVRLTWSPENESAPRWSPDGRYLAFLSGRQEGKGGQVWLLDRRGGEAQRITQIRGGVSSYAWAPDSRRLVLVIDEETDSAAARDTADKKTPKPIVIDRYEFKRDVVGYLGTKRSHLALLDLTSKKVDTLTRGFDDDGEASWSPDGSRIAFVRKPTTRAADVDNSDVWIMEARPGASPKRLTDFPGPDEGRLSWSPDGKWIAFTRGDEPKYYAYHLSRLAVVRADGAEQARVVSGSYDRPLSAPHFAADGKSVYATTEDDRAQHLLRIRLVDGRVERVVAGKRVIGAYTMGAGDRLAVLESSPGRAPEVYAWDDSALRPLSHQNDSLFAQLRLGTTEDFTSRSADGTEVHGLLVRPAGTEPRTRLPLLLYIHGGPNGQDSYSFSFDRELFAANGYAVLAVNYRGSSGRGSAYQKAIFGDWGNKEVVDLLGAVDEAVRRGIADADRLVVGGWSYGGILTDYTIATTTRFAAAVSGAGSALQLSMYGVDQYVTQYEQELGLPWKNPEAWLKVSYPFFHADRIRTPTLFMGGESDFNVPIVGGEQMYQALRTLGVPTQLVIYPKQFHGLTVPSYRVDRLQRYLAWYDRYTRVKPVQAGTVAP